MSWSGWNRKESQMTVGRQAAAGKVNKAKTIFEANSRRAAQAKTPAPKPAASTTNKHNYKGLAPGAFVKKGNHWTIARKQSNAPVVKAGATPPVAGAASFYERSPEPQTFQSFEPVEPKPSLRKSLTSTLRKSLQSVKSFVSEKSEKPHMVHEDMMEEEEEEEKRYSYSSRDEEEQEKRSFFDDEEEEDVQSYRSEDEVMSKKQATIESKRQSRRSNRSEEDSFSDDAASDDEW